MPERSKPADSQANYLSEISIASWTLEDVGPLRVRNLAQWQQRAASGVTQLPDEAQVAAHYIFGHYRREAYYRHRRKKAPSVGWHSNGGSRCFPGMSNCKPSPRSWHSYGAWQ